MYIYGLFSTKDNVIRYIGKTKNSLNKRLWEHLNGALKCGCNTFKDRWIRKCYRDGYEVKIKPIEIVNKYNINEKEVYWIGQFENLTNTARGGEGGQYPKYTISYSECKKWLQDNAEWVTSRAKFKKFSETDAFPDFIPKNPLGHFKITNEWKGWGDFLSTGKIQDNLIAKQYYSYCEAKSFLKKHKLINKKEYINFIKINSIKFLPKRPERYYNKRGWESYGDYLGIKKRYQITEELIIRYLCLFFKEVNTMYKYKQIVDKINYALPKTDKTFNKLYPNFKWYLVNNHLISNYKEAEKMVKLLNIKTPSEYKQIVNLKYKNILPKNPDLKYKNNGWKNWMVYLGNDTLKHKCDVSIEVFRRYMNRYFPNIKSGRKYRIFYTNNKLVLSKRLPSRPDIVYKQDFSCIFMVEKKRKVKICDYDTFINIMIEKYPKLTNSNEYKKLAKNKKLDPRMPHLPQHQYKKSWKEIISDINKNK